MPSTFTRAVDGSGVGVGCGVAVAGIDVGTIFSTTASEPQAASTNIAANRPATIAREVLLKPVLVRNFTDFSPGLCGLTISSS
jgi:hypothetical protein